MKKFTPTTDDVRLRYTEYPYVAQIEDEPGDGAEFDRWISAHDAEVIAKGRAEQREADAVIAETRDFGTGIHAQLHRWGSKQAAAAIREEATE